MSEFIENPIDTLVNDMTTLALTEPPGNTTETTPATNQSNYVVDFPDYGRVITCDWCRGVKCTDPECVTMLELEEDAKDRTCLDCEEVFGTYRQLEEHYQYCNCRSYPEYPEYSDLYCKCCGLAFETQEQFDNHTQELCYQQQQEQEHVIYCNYCGIAFETREQLYEHNPDRCWSNIATTVCSYHSEYVAHEQECLNDYDLSRMEESEREMWDEYQAELEEEDRMDDFRQQAIEEIRKEAKIDKAPLKK